MFRVKTSSDNNETFSQEMSHREHRTWVTEARSREFLAFAALETICKECSQAPDLFLPTFYLCYLPQLINSIRMHWLGSMASMDSDEQLTSMNKERAEWEERPLSDLFYNEMRCSVRDVLINWPREKDNQDRWRWDRNFFFFFLDIICSEVCSSTHY